MRTDRENPALWRRRLGPGVGIRRESARGGIGRRLLLALLFLRSVIAFPRPDDGKARKITQVSRPLGIIHTGDKIEEKRSAKRVRLPEPTRDKTCLEEAVACVRNTQLTRSPSYIPPEPPCARIDSPPIGSSYVEHGGVTCTGKLGLVSRGMQNKPLVRWRSVCPI